MKLRFGSVWMGLVLVWVAGCASTGSSASMDQLTANVGNYPPPPPGIERPKVGVPPFDINKSRVHLEGGVKAGLRNIAADQLTTLMGMTGRFVMVERAQLQQLLREQGLEGIVRADQLAKRGRVLGVDYLLLGEVTNFRVSVSQTKSGFGMGSGVMELLTDENLPGGSTGYSREKTQITTEVGVDIRLVDPQTGRVLVTSFGAFNRTDTASALGVSVMGVGGDADADIQIGKDDAGRLLRLALDNAIRKMLPRLDRKLRRMSSAQSGASTISNTSATTPASGSAASQAAQFCPQCGNELVAGATFCGACGARIAGK